SNPINIISWNVNGVNDPIKQYKILSHRAKLKCDVALLQEVHLVPAEMEKLRSRWVGRVFYFLLNFKKRGVCVLTSKSVLFSELKVESDNEGRYMIISCLLGSVEVTLASIYAPTGNPVSLYTDLAVSLSQHSSNRIILGGDWNGVWDPFVDKMGPVSSSDLSIARGLREFSREMGRAAHPKICNYTFYSGAHNFCSRLDTFFVSHLATIDVVEVSILNKIFSDHSPVQMLFLPDPHLQKRISWRLNNSLLKDDGLLNNLKNEIECFFQQNENSVDSYLTIWDAFKATIRLVNQKKLFQKTWKDLEVELTKLESLHKANPDDLELLGELKNMIILTRKPNLHYSGLKITTMKKGDKAGKLLAYRLHKLEMVNQISEIKDSNNKVTKQPDGIVSEFRSFYSHRYTSDTNCSDEDLGRFLDNIDLGSLTLEGQEELGKPIQ
uniref:exodeoxyribonuclease III n=1 Tax=Latimeria chalumnae TaxID=7897 RepID=H3A0G4_LATCH